jgi:hypothetical protein
VPLSSGAVHTTHTYTRTRLQAHTGGQAAPLPGLEEESQAQAPDCNSHTRQCRQAQAMAVHAADMCIRMGRMCARAPYRGVMYHVMESVLFVCTGPPP